MHGCAGTLLHASVEGEWKGGMGPVGRHQIFEAFISHVAALQVDLVHACIDAKHFAH